MAKTAKMRLVELMILKEDIDTVIEFLGKAGNFQLQQGLELNSEFSNPDQEILQQLKEARSFLNVEDIDTDFLQKSEKPTDYDRVLCQKLLSTVDNLRKREIAAGDELKRVEDSYKEAKSFANLKVPYSQPM